MSQEDARRFLFRLKVIIVSFDLSPYPGPVQSKFDSRQCLFVGWPGWNLLIKGSQETPVNNNIFPMNIGGIVRG